MLSGKKYSGFKMPIPAINNPKPNKKPNHAELRGVPARRHNVNRIASASTGIGKTPNGANPNTQLMPASKAQPE